MSLHLLLDKVQGVCQKQTLIKSFFGIKKPNNDDVMIDTSFLVMETTVAGKIEEETVDELEK